MKDQRTTSNFLSRSPALCMCGVFLLVVVGCLPMFLREEIEAERKEVDIAEERLDAAREAGAPPDEIAELEKAWREGFDELLAVLKKGEEVKDEQRESVAGVVDALGPIAGMFFPPAALLAGSAAAALRRGRRSA